MKIILLLFAVVGLLIPLHKRLMAVAGTRRRLVLGSIIGIMAICIPCGLAEVLKLTNNRDINLPLSLLIGAIYGYILRAQVVDSKRSLLSNKTFRDFKTTSAVSLFAIFTLVHIGAVSFIVMTGIVWILPYFYG